MHQGDDGHTVRDAGGAGEIVVGSDAGAGVSRFRKEDESEISWGDARAIADQSRRGAGGHYEGSGVGEAVGVSRAGDGVEEIIDGKFASRGAGGDGGGEIYIFECGVFDCGAY